MPRTSAENCAAVYRMYGWKEKREGPGRRISGDGRDIPWIFIENAGKFPRNNSLPRDPESPHAAVRCHGVSTSTSPEQSMTPIYRICRGMGCDASPLFSGGTSCNTLCLRANERCTHNHLHISRTTLKFPPTTIDWQMVNVAPTYIHLASASEPTPQPSSYRHKKNSRFFSRAPHM